MIFVEIYLWIMAIFIVCGLAIVFDEALDTLIQKAYDLYARSPLRRPQN